MKFCILYLCPPPLALSQSTTKKCYLPCLNYTFKPIDKIFWAFCSPGWNPVFFSITIYVRCTDPLIIFVVVLLGWLKDAYILLVVGSPWKHTRIPDVSHQCWEEGKDHPPWPAGNIFLNANQDAICLLCLKGALLLHGLLRSWWNPYVLSHRATFWLVMSHSVLVPGVILPWGAGLLISFCWSFWDSCRLITQLFKVPLTECRATSQCMNCSSRFVSSENFENALCPIVQVINEVVRRHWS